MTATFTPDHTGVGEMLDSRMMEGAMLTVAGGILTRAIAIAPVDEKSPHPGRYRASFHIRSHLHGGAKNDRAEAIVYNSAPEAPFVEWGNWGDEPEHILARAAFVGIR
jgi:hypothetical protein